MLLKLKRYDITMEGRGCAYGRKKNNWIFNTDRTFPTVSKEALFLSCMIDTTEGREIATADIPGDFLQTKCNKGEIHI